MLHGVVLLYCSTKTSNSKFVGGILPKFALLYTLSGNKSADGGTPPPS